ncbi:MAG: FAD-dependent oxidoreductase [Oscillochloris sp.]|nr:FAD-dependent oxidoreductase [Oscillochloris sp.]
MVSFDPPLSKAHRNAIGAFRLEAATKVFLRFDQRRWDAELAYMAHGGMLARWWTPFHHQPDIPLLCSYITADRARSFDALDDESARVRALSEASVLLGVPDLADHCLAMRRIAWAADPYACGGYAHIPPGAAAARTALAGSEGDRLHFAGEAAAFDSNPQTVHGAFDSGRRAAALITGSAADG